MFFRYLLHKENNPVFLVYQGIYDTLSECLAVKHFEIHDDFLMVQSHKSNLNLKRSDDSDPSEIHTTLGNTTEGPGLSPALEVSPTNPNSYQNLKELKDELNKKQKDIEMASERTFSHGVSPSNSHTHVASSEENTFVNLNKLLSTDAEAVYTAIKSTSVMSSGCEESHDEMDSSVRVFHLRTSLLEVLTNLLTQNSSEFIEPENVNSQNESTPKCIMFTGQGYQPCKTSPPCLPVKHEMLIACKVSESQKVTATCSGDAADCENSLVTKILIAMNDSKLCRDHSLKLQPNDGSCRIDINGVENISKLCSLEIHDKFSSRTSIVGLSLLGHIDSEQYEICLLNLDLLTSSICGLPDLRLLWSDSDKFCSQFNGSHFPSVYQPFSLYPMKFIHDLSFWGKDSEDTVDEYELCDAVSCVVGDVVVQLEKMDSSYVDPSSGCRSFCYRLHFMCLDRALPYSMSWKLQSEIRIEIARRLGVVLR